MYEVAMQAGSDYCHLLSLQRRQLAVAEIRRTQRIG
jgi:hypothetical protein